MKLQTIPYLDFDKAHLRIRDISAKLTKILCKNRETRTIQLVRALQKPLQRTLRDLLRVNIFREVHSIGENSDVGEGFKISFANLRVHKNNNGPILQMVLLNLKRKSLFVALQEIRFFALNKNLQLVNGILLNTQRELLRKILLNKQRQEIVLVQVYLQYWSQQAKISKLYNHFAINLKKVFDNHITNLWETLKIQTNKKAAIKRIVPILKMNFQQHFYQLSKIYRDLKLQQSIKQIYISILKQPFTEIQLLKHKGLFQYLIKYQRKFQAPFFKLLQLYSLRKLRKLRSIQYGLEDLTKTLNIRYAFDKLQKCKNKQKKLLQTRLLIVLMGRLVKRKLYHGFNELNQLIN